MQSARAKDVFFSKVKYKTKAKILLVYIKKLVGYYIKILVWLIVQNTIHPIFTITFKLALSNMYFHIICMVKMH